MVVMERARRIAIVLRDGCAGPHRSPRYSYVKARRWASVGTVIGVGAGFVTLVPDRQYHLIHLPPDMFMVSNVPVCLRALNFIAVAAATIVLVFRRRFTRHCRRARLSPVEVIRYE